MYRKRFTVTRSSCQVSALGCFVQRSWRSMTRVDGGKTFGQRAAAPQRNPEIVDRVSLQLLLSAFMVAQRASDGTFQGLRCWRNADFVILLRHLLCPLALLFRRSLHGQFLSG